MELPQKAEIWVVVGSYTARDYLAFTQMILHHGFQRQGILRPETVAMMSQNHIGDLHVTELKSVAPSLSNDTNFWPGMACKWGLSLLIDRERPQGDPPEVWHRRAGQHILLNRPDQTGDGCVSDANPAVLRS